MGIETASIVEGEVVKVLKHGAFIRLPEGKRGFVHISEIAETFVNNVGDYLSEGDRILVKCLGQNRKDQMELSFKQAGGVKVKGEARQPAPVPAGRETRPRLQHPVRVFSGLPVKPTPQNFEDKLQMFMRTSEERQGELKRNIENKRGGGRSRY